MIQKKKDYQPKTRFGRFMDQRLPLARIFYNIGSSRIPKNLNYLYSFGGILTLMLVLQVLTGIVLAMHYVPDVTMAFESRENFVRDGRFGWLFESWHATGSSFFFIAAYIHLAKGLYYGSYKAPRELVWIIGVLIYLTMIITAFLGYVLVWGMMSFSAISVIAGLFKAVPFIGSWLYEMLVGGYSIGQPTLNRFYVLHYLFPCTLIFLVFLHIWAVHGAGKIKPEGLEIAGKPEMAPLVPYAAIKDLLVIAVFLIFFSWFLFYIPDHMVHRDNYIPADPLKTSLHVMPAWYLLPFYTILRAITFDIGFINATLGGLLALLVSALILLFVPWLDRSPIRSARYRPLYRFFYWLFLSDFVILGWIGSNPAGDDRYTLFSQLATAYYFFFFLVIMPVLPFFEKIRTYHKTEKNHK